MPQMRPFTVILRRQGFTPDFDSRGGGERCWQWSKTIGRRKVIVQLWGSGCHRATHAFSGCENTAPTGFITALHMKFVIDYESKRMDNEYADKPTPAEVVRAAGLEAW